MAAKTSDVRICTVQAVVKCETVCLLAVIAPALRYCAVGLNHLMRSAIMWHAVMTFSCLIYSDISINLRKKHAMLQYAHLYDLYPLPTSKLTADARYL